MTKQDAAFVVELKDGSRGCFEVNMCRACACELLKHGQVMTDRLRLISLYDMVALKPLVKHSDCHACP